MTHHQIIPDDMKIWIRNAFQTITLEILINLQKSLGKKLACALKKMNQIFVTLL